MDLSMKEIRPLAFFQTIAVYSLKFNFGKKT